MSRFFRPAGDSDSDSETEESSEEELIDSDDEAAPSKPTAAKPKATGMARFLKGAASTTSSSEESEEDEESDEDEDEPKARKMNAFLVGDDGSESDEDTKRVVKSASAKRMDEMEGVGKTIENALKINDWVAISNGALYAELQSCRVALTSFQSLTSWDAWSNVRSTCRSECRTSTLRFL